MGGRIQGSCLCQAVQFEVPAQPLMQTLCLCAFVLIVRLLVGRTATTRTSYP